MTKRLDIVELFARRTDRRIKKLLNSEWIVGFQDRGMGHGNFGIITKKKGLLITQEIPKEIAEHIVEIHNYELKK